MNNKEFIAKLAEESGFSVEDTQKLVRSVLSAMCKSFKDGEPVQIHGFGTFEVKKRLERVMVHPSTGRRMLVPPKLTLAFKPNLNMREKVKTGGEA